MIEMTSVYAKGSTYLKLWYKRNFVHKFVFMHYYIIENEISYMWSIFKGLQFVW